MAQLTEVERPPLDAAGLAPPLISPGGLWREIRVVAETGSTNADLLAAARAGAAEGLVLAAEAQTAGRGRLGRSWVSPPRAALTFSVLLRRPRSRRPLVAGCRCSPASPWRRRCAPRRPSGRPEMAERRAGGGPEARRDPGRGTR